MNFLPEWRLLPKETDYMLWTGFKVVPSIMNKVSEINVYYPNAISLIESVKTFKRICERLNEKTVYQDLVAGMKKDIQNSINKMSGLF